MKFLATVAVFLCYFLPLSIQAAYYNIEEISPNEPRLSASWSIKLNNIIIFSMSDTTHGSEPWKYDSSTGSLTLIKDIFQGSDGSGPSNFIEFKGEVYFSADDGVHGYELWKTDGTEAGTQLVVDLYTGPDSGIFAGTDSWLVAFDDELYFGGDNGAQDGVFKSDGTATGTSWVWDTANPHGYPKFFYSVNNRVLFVINDATHGEQWWQTDGTNGGTSIVPDPSKLDSNFGGISGVIPVVLNDVIYYQGSYINNGATDGTGRELYRTDGTPAGTYMVKDINADPFVVNSDGNSFASNFTIVGQTLFFTAYDGATGGNGYALWKSDGTEAGTVMVKDIHPDTDTSNPFGALAEVNGSLYFRGDDGTHGEEIWSSDGTESGTVMVEDIISGAGSSEPRNFTYYDGVIFFRATDGVNGAELWQTDGTPGGAMLAKDIYTGASGSYPGDLTVVGDELLFRASPASKDYNLYRISKAKQGSNFYIIKAANGTVIALPL